MPSLAPFDSISLTVSRIAQKLDEDERTKLKRECAMMSSLRHPLLVQFIAITPDDESEFTIVTELMTCVCASRSFAYLFSFAHSLVLSCPDDGAEAARCIIKSRSLQRSRKRPRPILLLSNWNLRPLRDDWLHRRCCVASSSCIHVVSLIVT